MPGKVWGEVTYPFPKYNYVTSSHIQSWIVLVKEATGKKPV